MINCTRRTTSQILGGPGLFYIIALGEGPGPFAPPPPVPTPMNLPSVNKTVWHCDIKFQLIGIKIS